MITQEVRKTVRGGRAMTADELSSFLAGARYGVLSFVNDEGWPDMRPLNIAWHNGCFYFHTHKFLGEKLPYLDGNKRAVFCLYESSDRVGLDPLCSHESILAYGHIDRIDGKEELQEEVLAGMRALCISGGTPWKGAEGREQRMLTGAAVFRFTPEHIAGKISCFLSLPPSSNQA